MPDITKIPTEDLLKMRAQASQPATPSISEIPTEDLLKMRDDAIEAERPKKSVAESAMRGAAQGISQGWIDEATADVGAAYQAGKAMLGLRGDVSFGDAKSTLLKHIRAQDDAAHKDNPWTYRGAMVGGGAASLAVPGIAAERLAASSLPAAQIAGRRLAGAAEGVNTLKGAAALGAVSGGGFSEANPLESPEQLGQFGKDVAGGALTGAAAYGAAKGIGKLAHKFSSEGLEETANVKALKAAGYMGPELKKMSYVEKQEAGKLLRESGVVKAFDSLDDIATKAASQKETAGQAIGAALDSVDGLVGKAHQLIDEGKLGGNLPPQVKQALKEAVTKQFQFNMGRIGDRIESELIEPNVKNPLLKGEVAKLQGIADDFRAGGSLSMREGNVIKGTQGKITNFNSDTVPQAFKQELYGIIKSEIDDIVAKTGNLEAAVARGEGNAIGTGADVATRNKSVLGDFLASKKGYGVFKNAEDVATTRQGQLQANREVSLTDTIAAVGGLAAGGPASAIAIGGLNKLSRQYGDSVMAVTAGKAADILAKAPNLLGPFAPALENAARMGTPALAATHQKLLQNPDYQRILADYEGSDTAIKRRLSGFQNPQNGAPSNSAIKRRLSE